MGIEEIKFAPVKNESTDGSHNEVKVEERKKPVPPGSYQPDCMTDEEKAMSSPELDKLIESINNELEDLRDQVVVANDRVRLTSLGQDRYHRFYWQLPSIGGLLVEPSDSATRNNPMNSHVGLTPVSSLVDPDAAACLSDLLQKVELKNRCPVIPLTARRPWKIIKEENVGRVHEHLLVRGIRERLLSRGMHKYKYKLKGEIRKARLTKCNPLNLANLKLDQTSQQLTSANINMSALQRLSQSVDELRKKIIRAKVQNNNDIKLSPLELTELDLPEDIWSHLRKCILELETCVDRKYLKAPFNRSHSRSPDDEPDPQDQNVDKVNEDTEEYGSDTAELVNWRNVVETTRSAAQLALCIQQLDGSIAWHRSPTRVYCQICRESQLLLCDGCEGAYHTFCFKPKLTVIPTGDWFCPVCLTPNTDGQPCCLLCITPIGQTQLTVCYSCNSNFHSGCIDSHTSDIPFLCVACAGPTTTLKSCTPPPESPSTSHSFTPVISNQRSTIKRQKSFSNKLSSPSTDKDKNFTEHCSKILSELESHKSAGPFLEPVDAKACPLYKKIIKTPMDLSKVRSKLKNHKYATDADFLNDIQLIWENCRIFNEDESQIGKAGATLKRLFSKRWKEINKN